MKRLLLALLLLSTSTFAQTQIGGGSGGGNPNAVGPVINVTNPSYSGCFATVTNGQDWSTCFASVATLATNAAYTSVGTPTVRTSFLVAACAGGCTSNTVTGVTLTAGDTACVFVSAAGANGVGTTTVTDGSLNQYMPITVLSVNGGASSATQWFCTPAGGVKALSSGTVTISNSGGNQIGAIVLDIQNVGTIGQVTSPGSSNSTAPTQNMSIVDANNLVLAGVSWFNGATSNISANVGTLLTSSNATSTLVGEAVITNTGAINSTLTTSATLSVSATWELQQIEMRSVTVSVPIVYFPCPAGTTGSTVCTYNYASGLVFPNWVTLKGDPGTFLCYTGTGIAADFGTSRSGSGANGYSILPNAVDTIGWTCGGSMSDGLKFEQYNTHAFVVRSRFINFGNSGANVYAIDSRGSQETFFIYDNVWWTNDGIPRKWIIASDTTNSTEPQIRGNYSGCVNGVVAGGGACGTAAGTAPLITLSASQQAIISENNINFHCPFVLISGGINAQIVNNSMEVLPAGCPGLIQFSGAPATSNLLVADNYVNLHGTSFLLAPFNGTSTLTQAIVRHNRIVSPFTGNPIVSLNNLTGQTGNFAYGNTCAGQLCPITHTAGSNITQWNQDYYPKFVFAASTTATYTFAQASFSVVPVCTIPPNIPGTVTTLTISTLNATTITITASASNSATVFGVCSAGDAQ